jgi:DNA invertase Pin-like site-specific DNA recombinase
LLPVNVLDRLGKGGVSFRTLREPAVDITSPQGRLVVAIMAAISEFEREIILSRWMKVGSEPDRMGLNLCASRS